MLFGIEYSFWYSLSLNGKRVWLTQSRMNYKCCTSNISWCIFSSVFKKSKKQIMKIISTFFLGEFWYPLLSEIYLPLFGPIRSVFNSDIPPFETFITIIGYLKMFRGDYVFPVFRFSLIWQFNGCWIWQSNSWPIACLHLEVSYLALTMGLHQCWDCFVT